MNSWPHAPARVAIQQGIVMVTASTYQKQPLFEGEERLALLQEFIFRHCDALDWRLQAWAIFANHYHFISLTPETPNLRVLVKRIHASSARKLNELDGEIGRKVWYRYWDTQITYKNSYLARLAYVHQNPVRHGLVERAEHYPFCSMSWFLAQSERPFRDTVLSFKTDRVNVNDDYEM